MVPRLRRSALRSDSSNGSWIGCAGSETSWEKQRPTSRHETRGTGDGDLFVHRAERATDDNDWTVVEMCRVLEVSRSGFYGWQSRPRSEWAVTDALLAVEIEAIWKCSDRTYGAPRVHRWLRKQEFWVSRKRVARIMRAHDFEGESGRRRVRTTIVDRGATAASDLVGRDFNPTEPDTTWVGDITYLRTGEGWLFLATVIDLFSRRVIGWSVATDMRTSLVADALEMAVATRGGAVTGVIFHSDRGSIHLRRFRRALRRPGRDPVHGRATGVCWDNAAAEAFFGTLKRSWPTGAAG